MRIKETFLKGAMLLFLMLAFNPSYGINQSSTVDQAIALYDEEKYQEAINLFLTVDENDSSFVRMITELALTYNATGNYDSSIICCRRGLEEISSYANNIYGLMATSYDMKGELDSAIYYYKKAIDVEPYNYLDHFNLGVTYYNAGGYRPATTCFQEALRCNPFHSSSHLYLGLLAARQKQLTKAMLSIETFLMLEPNSTRSNKYLIFLNNLSQNYIDTTDGSFIEPFLANEPYEFIDHLIRSRVVLVDDFETIIDFNAPVVKQTQVLFDKLPKEKTDDFWSEMYWEFFATIKENAYIEPMLCTILRSAGSEAISKWTEKNDKIVSEFYSVGSHLSGVKYYKLLDFEGAVKRYTIEYDDDGGIYSIGNTETDKQVGYWQYFWSHGGVRSEGMIDNDEKTGVWKYYSWEGILDFSTVMKEGKNDGKANKYHPNKELRYTLEYVNGEPEGEVVFFSNSGCLSEKITYKEGVRDGEGVQFYGTGDTSSVYFYKDGELDGKNTSYHTDGSVLELSDYKIGKLDGPYISYHYGGQLASQGNYKDGNRTGEWLIYYHDGTLNQHLFYNDSVICGERKDYYRTGVLSTIYKYNGKGELDGRVEYYSKEGSLYIEELYKSNKLVGIKNYSTSSELIDEYLSEDATFSFKTYYPNGKVKREGHFKDGLKDGEWITYWINGNVKVSEIFLGGENTGESKSYYINGQLEDYISRKSQGDYDEHASYHINGVLKSSGLRINGENTHHWLYYRIDGALEQKSYFAEGQLNGWLSNFTSKGRLALRTKYDEGLSTINEWYNESGELINKVDLYHEEEMKVLGEDGRIMMEVACIDFNLEDTLKWYYPSGKQRSQIYLENGISQGKYCSWSRQGNVDGLGQYWNGDKWGKWIWYYDNGKDVSDENYYVNDELDSLQKDYNEEGILVAETYYQVGLKHGSHILFSNEGEPMIKMNYWQDELLSYQEPTLTGWEQEVPIEEGNEKIISHYPNGQLAMEIQLKDFLFEGDLIKYTVDGEISQKMSYTLGLTDGIAVAYYTPGKLKYKKTFKLGELNGESTWYFPNGNEKKKCNFYMGDSEGTDYHYSENGELISAEVYFGNAFMKFSTND